MGMGAADFACLRPAVPHVLSSLALGPGCRSRFFDPKARLTAAPVATWRGKSGHHRAGCCASRKASAGAAGQAAATDSVTENIPPFDRLRACPEQAAQAARRRARVKRWGKSPPRPPRGGRHEKPLLVQDKIGDWAARPIVSGMSHPPSLARFGARAKAWRAGFGRLERNDG